MTAIHAPNLKLMTRTQIAVEGFFIRDLKRSLAYVSLLLVGLLTVVPFLQPFHDLPYTSFYSQWAALALGVVACVPFTLRSFWENLSIPKVAIPLAGFVALFAAQHPFVQHSYASQALVPALYVSWAICLTVVAAWLRATLGIDYLLRIFAWIMLFGGILHALLGLAQYFNLPGYLAAWLDYNPPGSPISGNVGQANHYATQLTLASIALIYLYAVARLSIFLALPLVVLLVFGLTLSASRSVLLYCTGILFMSLLVYLHSHAPKHRRLVMMAAFVLATLVLVQMLAPFLNDWLHGAMANVGFETSKLAQTALERARVTDGIQLRISEWHKAGLMFWHSPLWGIGFGNYGWYSFNYQALPQFSALSTPDLFHNSHNLFAQLAAETGALGLLLLFTLLWLWFKQYLLEWWSDANWFIGACLLVLFVHSNLEYPLWYSYFLGIAAFFVGVSDVEKVYIRFSPRLGQVASVIAIVIIGVILLTSCLGYRVIANTNSLIYTTSPETAARTIQSVARNPLLTPWAEQVIATHGIADKNGISRQLALTTRVMVYHPNPVKVRRQIEYLTFAGHTDEASSLLKTAAKAYPIHVPNYICRWRHMTGPEIETLANQAENLLPKSVMCQGERPEPFRRLQSTKGNR